MGDALDALVEWQLTHAELDVAAASAEAERWLLNRWKPLHAASFLPQ